MGGWPKIWGVPQHLEDTIWKAMLVTENAVTAAVWILDVSLCRRCAYLIQRVFHFSFWLPLTLQQNLPPIHSLYRKSAPFWFSATGDGSDVMHTHPSESITRGRCDVRAQSIFTHFRFNCKLLVQGFVQRGYASMPNCLKYFPLLWLAMGKKNPLGCSCGISACWSRLIAI